MIADAEIAAFLSAETGADERFVFACDDAVLFWSPEHRYVQGPGFMRDELNEVLLNYLRQRGRTFKTIEVATSFYSRSSS